MSAYGTVIVNAIKNNHDAIVAFISANEATISAEAKQFIKDLPRPHGLVGLLFPLIEAEVNAEIDRLVNQGDPESLYALVLAAAERL